MTSVWSAENDNFCPINCKGQNAINHECKRGVKNYNIIFPSDSNTDVFIEPSLERYCDCEEIKKGSKGLTGSNCDIEFEKCDNDKQVCFHGAPCIPINDEYICGCPYTSDPDITYVGEHCEYKVDEFCPVTKEDSKKFSKYDISQSGEWFCTNKGTCQNGVVNPEEKCRCETGHFGLHCEHKDQPPPCAIKCENGGTCTTGVKDYTNYDESLQEFLQGDDLQTYLNGDNTEYCVCPTGFTGNLCEHQISECGDGVCMNGAKCITTDNGHYCDCSGVTITEPDGQIIPHAGTSCETMYSTMCEALDGYPTEEAFCTNGGTCPSDPHLPCICNEGSTGPRCEFKASIVVPGDDNKGGNKVTTKVDPKQDCSLQCENGGTCFFGDTPESSDDKFDLLISSPDTKSGKHCKCPPGYAGYLCEIKIEVCGDFEHHCQNSGQCVQDNSNDWKCDCMANSTDRDGIYAGTNCEMKASSFCVGPGASNEFFCTNDGVCEEIVEINTRTHPGCKCSKGYHGEFCEFKITSTKTGGVAGKAFLGFTLTLFGLVTIFLGAYFFRMRGAPDEGRHNPIGVPHEVNLHARDLDNEHDNTVYMGAGYENEDEQGDVMDDVNIYN